MLKDVEGLFFGHQHFDQVKGMRVESALTFLFWFGYLVSAKVCEWKYLCSFGLSDELLATNS